MLYRLAIEHEKINFRQRRPMDSQKCTATNTWITAPPCCSSCSEAEAGSNRYFRALTASMNNVALDRRIHSPDGDTGGSSDHRRRGVSHDTKCLLNSSFFCSVTISC
jgi:hypothetical protein